MNTRKWRDAIRARLGEREDLSSPALLSTYWHQPGLPPNDIEKLFHEFNKSYGLSSGVLRPDDRIALFREPVPSANPVTRALYQYWTDEAWNDIDTELGKRMHKRGQKRYAEGIVNTIDDLVWAWCGRLSPEGDHLAAAQWRGV